MRTSRVFKAMAVGVAGWVLVASSSALAADDATQTTQTEQDLSKLRALLEQQRQQLEQQQRALQAQQKRLEALEAQLNEAETARTRPALYRPGQVPPQSPASDGNGRKGGVVQAQGSQSQGQAQPQGTVGQPARERDRPPEIQALAEEGGVLLPRGKLAIEPSVEYTRSDVNRAEIAGFTVLPGIVVGNINVVEANRDTFVTAVTARYGITNRLEVEAKVPYVTRSDSTTTRPLGTGASSDVTTPAHRPTSRRKPRATTWATSRPRCTTRSTAAGVAGRSWSGTSA